MKRAALLGLLLLFAGTTSASAGEMYSSKDGKYSLTFPQKPKEQSQEIALPGGSTTKLYMALVEISNDKALISTYSDYPEDLIKAAPPQMILEGVRDGAKGAQGKIISDKAITIGADKIPGREYILLKGNFYQRFRVYLRGPRLYQVGVVANTMEGVTNNEATAFLDSFKVLK